MIVRFETSRHKNKWQCMGAKKAVIGGMPDFQHISTSFTER
jgi:hypothetical protein